MSKTIVGAIALFVALLAGAALAQDMRGSADHPAVTRYPGSVIRWYDIQAHMPYRIATGPVAGYRRIDRWQDVAGKTTRIYYELRGQRTHAEVYANYKKALLDNGFTLIADGLHLTTRPTEAVGGRNWLDIHYGANAVPASAGVTLTAGSATAGGTGVLAGRKGALYVVIGLAQQQADKVAYLVDVIETAPVQTGLVTITAKAIADGLDANGKVVLDGLFFDTDKATLRAESKPALDQIVSFLAGRPAQRVFVVGHTDITGAFAHNRDLSEARARSVLEALVQAGIARPRLEAYGVGPLSPVAGNRTEAGKARNRRVELVAR